MKFDHEERANTDDRLTARPLNVSDSRREKSDTPVSPNRLRSHHHRQQSEKPKTRSQRDIVRDFRDDIIGLIKEDGARLADVVAAVAAEGEVVLAAGFKAEILKQIGTVKALRAGRTKTAVLPGPAAAPVVGFLIEDADDDFAARRPRS